MDDIIRFETAWNAFATACSDTVAPEATYQAWFAHFLMEHFDPLQVVREVDFGSKYLNESLEDLDRFPGSNLMLDVMILRDPMVDLPRRSTLGPRHSDVTPNPRSGLCRLKRFTIISELKVGSSQGLGLGYRELVRDFHKLDAILRAVQRDHPEDPLPISVMCILDNNTSHRLNRAHLDDLLEGASIRSPIRVLLHPETPALKWSSRTTSVPDRPVAERVGGAAVDGSRLAMSLRDAAAGAYHLDPDAGEIRFRDGEVGLVPADGGDMGSSARTGGGSSGNVRRGSPSAVRRLLDEVSWEGNAKKYRGGGGHLENVVTAEVFAALDFLPRGHFLGQVLLAAHGADGARSMAAGLSEESVVDVLPGDLSPTWLTGDATGWGVQPDVLISSPDSLIYVEAKAPKGGKFSARQLARSLHATIEAAGDRTALLLLVPDSPPPLRVQGLGRLSLADALEAGLDGFPPEDADRLRTVMDRTLAWTTWDDIAASVEGSLAEYPLENSSLRGTVMRLASTLVDVIRPPA
ncbi:MAG: hypothetical protein NTX29_14670 [Actinobacteria bacterium]|nr:hypothetical protein [Actinomycetota bacterium]